MTFCAGFGAENTAPESAPIKPLHSRINNMEGKIVAVSGGAQGIGFSTVDLLLSKGARVSVGDLDEAKLSSAEEHFQTAVKEERVRFQKVDVSNSKQVDSWIAETVKWGGRLDGAVNAAGINCSESGQPTLADTSDERWNLLLSVNLTVSRLALIFVRPCSRIVGHVLLPPRRDQPHHRWRKHSMHLLGPRAFGISNVGLIQRVEVRR